MPIRIRRRDKPTYRTKPTGYKGFSAPLAIARMACYAVRKLMTPRLAVIQMDPEDRPPTWRRLLAKIGIAGLAILAPIVIAYVAFLLRTGHFPALSSDSRKAQVLASYFSTDHPVVVRTAYLRSRDSASRLVFQKDPYFDAVFGLARQIDEVFETEELPYDNRVIVVDPIDLGIFTPIVAFVWPFVKVPIYVMCPFGTQFCMVDRTNRRSAIFNLQSESAMMWCTRTIVILGTVAALFGTSCAPTEPNDLDKLGTVRLSIKGQPFELWIADELDELRRGLMFTPKEQMAPLPDGTKRGMIFVFDHEQQLNFWMKNTIIPLDIAYLDSSGKVVATYTMPALDDRLGQYPSRSPARFAIEVNANVLSELGVGTDDTIEIPPSVLTRTP